MAQTRAVMPSKFVPLADELLATTGASDYSTLIGILLSRYGKHLLNTWEIANCPQAAAIQQPIAPVSIAQPETFTPMEF
ncbi:MULTISPECIES: hypothetical protein [unclassified Microcoleus]|uniref:hypothetical protein n=1 Tax=unclassified Microcoleus TaxID=2642155 RepID=UPI002FD1C2B4